MQAIKNLMEHVYGKLSVDADVLALMPLKGIDGIRYELRESVHDFSSVTKPAINITWQTPSREATTAESRDDFEIPIVVEYLTAEKTEIDTLAYLADFEKIKAVLLLKANSKPVFSGNKAQLKEDGVEIEKEYDEDTKTRIIRAILTYRYIENRT
jgi:hypothetical protein